VGIALSSSHLISQLKF